MFGKVNRNQVAQIRWLRATNAYAGQIPAFAAVKVTGCDATGRLTVSRPDAVGQDVYLNGPIPIAQGSTGAITHDVPFWALYDATTGTPAFGDTWGAQSGSFLLGKGNAGFLVEGGAGPGRVMVRRPEAVGLTSGGASLISNYTATSTPGSVGAPFPVTIASAGTYLLVAQVMGSIALPNTAPLNSEAYLLASLYDVTNSSVLTTTAFASVYVQAAGVSPAAVGTGNMSDVLTLAAGTVIDLQAAWAGSGGPAASVFASLTGFGFDTRLNWVKLA